MFWLGLILAVAFVPGYTGASLPTQWAVLSIVLPLGLWRVAPYTTLHKLFLLGGGYAVLSLTWSLNLYSAIYGLWLFGIWFLAFHWGTLCDDLRPFWKGLAVGLWASAAITMAQALDYAPVEANDPFHPSGLFFNSSLLGVILGLTLVALASHKLWWYTPPLVLALILSGSRGGLLILAVGLLARYLGLLIASGALAIGALAFLFGTDLADNQRLQIWGVTLNAIDHIGRGIGSFGDVYFVRHTKVALIRPEFVHNDPLQLFFELGVPSLAIIAIAPLALAATRSAERPLLFAWLCLSLFYFPLYTPLTAFIGMVVAGHCARDWNLVWAHSDRWRSLLISRAQIDEYGIHRDGDEAIPLVSRATHTEA